MDKMDYELNTKQYNESRTIFCVYMGQSQQQDKWICKLLQPCNQWNVITPPCSSFKSCLINRWI